MSEHDDQHKEVPGLSDCGRLYEICVEGKLDASWADWFEGLDLRDCGEKCTVLFGRIADQAALLGILNKLCGLNIPLVSVNEVPEAERSAEAPPQGGARR